MGLEDQLSTEQASEESDSYSSDTPSQEEVPQTEKQSSQQETKPEATLDCSEEPSAAHLVCFCCHIMLMFFKQSDFVGILLYCPVIVLSAAISTKYYSAKHCQ